MSLRYLLCRWDTRRLSEPTDSLQLSTDARGDGQVLGGSSLEYNSEAGPSKYLVGTEQGVVLLVNLKNRKQNNGITVFDQGPGKHHGPVYAIQVQLRASIYLQYDRTSELLVWLDNALRICCPSSWKQRNPTNSKCFLTVGDWTARIWMEDLRTPIMSTKYHNSYLTSGCWSPTRPGVFFVTRMDGVIDIWDYFYRQNEVAYSHKVGESILSSIAVQGSMQSGGGKLVAVGDVSGTVSLLEVCDSLATQQPNEKKAIDSMFDREMKQEKNLENREKELRRQR